MRYPRTSAISVILATLALLTSGANAADQDSGQLKDSKAIQAVTGSTIVFADEQDIDGITMIYIGNDHTFDALIKGEISSGEWFEKKDLLCLDYEKKCYAVSIDTVDGTLNYLIDDDGAPTRFTIEAGNKVDDSAAK